MILEHEVPHNSLLAFAKSARLKRRLEALCVEEFYKEGFEEIITPTFVYEQHQKSFLDRDVIRISSESNNQISLRNDSTLEVARIITRRLGRTTNEKKWFYIQPVFSYPTTELSQIGVEYLEQDRLEYMLELSIKIFKKFHISPILQVTNARIALLCCRHENIDLGLFERQDVAALMKYPLMKKLIEINDKESLKAYLPHAPSFLKEELASLLELTKDIEYEKVVFSFLLLAPVDYYKGAFFRMFLGNSFFCSGGVCSIDDLVTCGFGIYTDGVVSYLLKHKVTL
ncbi:ATP phosphoribosyltransferase regulatory subunit [Helicobacter sp. 11S02629-2]|uniref:ATP phosphoribosyltransferase regulatory subunit n=1 Tax=Helicobacter sp. 11S02629-2 TaxID=1476195 RepID=UPI000BA7E178|nr:ATP phosphoribosyltransferase regulatory subunit [Helicobacter sp. 11S02629-2]PAF44969.1 ATP phosphoribosyltransferase regulatory subunit [Helicobacter sp. 11S02629-2]